MQYSFSLNDFSAYSLKNVLFSLYSKGPLLSKAVNGQFFVPEELCHKIAYTAMMEKIIAAMQDSAELVGIEIRDDQLIFTGFNAAPEQPSAPEQAEAQITADQEQQDQSETQNQENAPEQPENPAITAFLFYFINHCKAASYIQLVSPETDNERYTMRGWFNQIGWLERQGRSAFEDLFL